MRLNSYICSNKYIFLTLLFSSFLFASCIPDYICRFPEEKISVNNKNSQIYVLNFSDSEISVEFTDESTKTFAKNSDSNKTYKIFSDSYSQKCSTCGQSHLMEGYFFTYPQDKDFIYLLNDSEKLFDLKTNFETLKQISIKQGEQIFFQSELKQNLESQFELYSHVISNSDALTPSILKNGNFLFTSEQKTEPNVKIIVQWTKQNEEKTYTSPIYTIIIPPQS